MRFPSLTRSSIPLLAALALATPVVAGAQGVERPRLPLRTALNELSAFRAEYQEAFNKGDHAAVAAMYAPDATLITAEGQQFTGREAIGKALFADSTAGTMKLESDTTRVVGHTAWDIGRVTVGDKSSRYLVVLRRGLKEWQLASVAVVPERGDAMGSK